MMLLPQIVDLGPDQRLASIANEIYAKGNVFAAEDITRRQLLVLGQKMTNIQHAIEECVGEDLSLASLFEAASMKIRKGRTGSFRVVRMHKEDVGAYLNERMGHFQRVCIATTDPNRWPLQQVGAA